MKEKKNGNRCAIEYIATSRFSFLLIIAIYNPKRCLTKKLIPTGF